MARQSITPNQYQSQAMRTKCDQLKALRKLVNHSSEHNGMMAIQLLHGLIGLQGEVGELAGMIERFLYYGQEFDRQNFIEEVGDSMWYIAELLDAIDSPLGQAMFDNIEKLRKRFPDKFTEHDALEENRNRENEVSHIPTHNEPRDIDGCLPDPFSNSKPAFERSEDVDPEDHYVRASKRVTLSSSEKLADQVKKETLRQARDMYDEANRRKGEIPDDVVGFTTLVYDLVIELEMESPIEPSYKKAEKRILEICAHFDVDAEDHETWQYLAEVLVREFANQRLADSAREHGLINLPAVDLVNLYLSHKDQKAFGELRDRCETKGKAISSFNSFEEVVTFLNS